MHQKQNTTMMILAQITQVLTDALQTLGYPEKEIKLSPPKNPEFGDLSTNLPLILTKDLKQNPMEIGEAIKDVLDLSGAIIDTVTVTPPGFINFKIDKSFYQSKVKTILDENDSFGKSSLGAGKQPTLNSSAQIQLVPLRWVMVETQFSGTQFQIF